MVDSLTVIALIEKGLTVVSMLVDAGKAVKPAVDILLGLTKAQQEGGVSEADLVRFETELDALIEDFNEPLE